MKEIISVYLKYFNIQQLRDCIKSGKDYFWRHLKKSFIEHKVMDFIVMEPKNVFHLNIKIDLNSTFFSIPNLKSQRIMANV